jgi:hypothetical protein
MKIDTFKTQPAAHTQIHGSAFHESFVKLQEISQHLKKTEDVIVEVTKSMARDGIGSTSRRVRIAVCVAVCTRLWWPRGGRRPDHTHHGRPR